jgi:hypothetical protein
MYLYTINFIFSICQIASKFAVVASLLFFGGSAFAQETTGNSQNSVNHIAYNTRFIGKLNNEQRITFDGEAGDVISITAIPHLFTGGDDSIFLEIYEPDTTTPLIIASSNTLVSIRYHELLLDGLYTIVIRDADDDTEIFLLSLKYEGRAVQPSLDQTTPLEPDDFIVASLRPGQSLQFSYSQQHGQYVAIEFHLEPNEILPDIQMIDADGDVLEGYETYFTLERYPTIAFHLRSEGIYELSVSSETRVSFRFRIFPVPNIVPGFRISCIEEELITVIADGLEITLVDFDELRTGNIQNGHDRWFVFSGCLHRHLRIEVEGLQGFTPQFQLLTEEGLELITGSSGYSDDYYLPTAGLYLLIISSQQQNGTFSLRIDDRSDDIQGDQ